MLHAIALEPTFIRNSCIDSLLWKKLIESLSSFKLYSVLSVSQVICNKCSSYEAPLCYLQYKTERVCKECFETLYKGNEMLLQLVYYLRLTN